MAQDRLGDEQDTELTRHDIKEILESMPHLLARLIELLPYETRPSGNTPVTFDRLLAATMMSEFSTLYVYFMHYEREFGPVKVALDVVMARMQTMDVGSRREYVQHAVDLVDNLLLLSFYSSALLPHEVPDMVAACLLHDICKNGSVADLNQQMRAGNEKDNWQMAEYAISLPLHLDETRYVRLKDGSVLDRLKSLTNLLKKTIADYEKGQLPAEVQMLHEAASLISYYLYIFQEGRQGLIEKKEYAQAIGQLSRLSSVLLSHHSAIAYHLDILHPALAQKLRSVKQGKTFVLEFDDTKGTGVRQSESAVLEAVNVLYPPPQNWEAWMLWALDVPAAGTRRGLRKILATQLNRDMRDDEISALEMIDRALYFYRYEGDGNQISFTDKTFADIRPPGVVMRDDIAMVRRRIKERVEDTVEEWRIANLYTYLNFVLHEFRNYHRFLLRRCSNDFLAFKAEVAADPLGKQKGKQRYKDEVARQFLKIIDEANTYFQPAANMVGGINVYR